MFDVVESEQFAVEQGAHLLDTLGVEGRTRFEQILERTRGNADRAMQILVAEVELSSRSRMAMHEYVTETDWFNLLNKSINKRTEW